MDVLTIDNCFLKNNKIIMKFADEGIAIKEADGNVITIKKDDIKDIELFRSISGVCLRIYENQLLSVNSIAENFIDEIIRYCNDFYKINVYLKELEISNVSNGELLMDGKGNIEFRHNKTIFNIPLKDIDGLGDIRNELSVKFNNTEVRFITTKEVINVIKDSCNNSIEEDILTFESITMMYPRGKNNFKLYKDHFRIIGYSYDHKIFYKNVKEIFFLDKNYIGDEEKYVLFSLENPLVQGLTKYSLIVISFGNEEVDIEVNDPNLEQRYHGLFSDVFVTIFQKLTNLKAITSKFTTSDNRRGAKCNFKAYEGQIYLLQGCIIFLPRSLRINLQDIEYVEFSRINISVLQAKTFDMTIRAESNYVFNGLYKEDFGILEKYFNENNVPIRSEVYEEVISSEEDDEELTDEDFVVSEDEE